MGGSGRIVAYRMTKSDGDEDVRAGSRFQKGPPAYSFHLELHLRDQKGPLDEDIRQLLSPYPLCSTLKASREE